MTNAERWLLVGFGILTLLNTWMLAYVVYLLDPNHFPLP